MSEVFLNCFDSYCLIFHVLNTSRPGFFLTLERSNFKTNVTKTDVRSLMMEMLDFKVILKQCSSYCAKLSVYIKWATDFLNELL